ncbi:hypothetical protein G6F68_019565 [Rhizopus microsporus]|nr:hypothetical protein G6F68_019565 [Rhizopus microsporus]
MLVEISLRNISATLRMPALPPTAAPNSWGRPVKTMLAPRATALSTSEPRRKPPSTMTGKPAGTAATTSGSACKGVMQPCS